MGWDSVEDKKLRAKYLGSWSSDKNVVLFTRYGTEFHASVYDEKNPKTGKRCPSGMKHDYRHMVGPNGNDLGGYVCLKDSPWDYETKEKSCDEFGVLKCRWCGDEYNPTTN